MQTECPLPQLNPVGQHIVIGIDLFGELADISGVALRCSFHFMENAVDERCDTIDKRHLRTLLQIVTLGIFHT